MSTSIFEVCTVDLDCYLDWLRLAALTFYRKHIVGGVSHTFLLTLQNILRTRLPVRSTSSLRTLFRFCLGTADLGEMSLFVTIMALRVLETTGVCGVLATAAIAVTPVLSALLLLYSVHWSDRCMRRL